MDTTEIFRLKPPSNIGVVGVGQLGRMLTVEAKRMGYNIIQVITQLKDVLHHNSNNLLEL